jgi:hypothetical protein
MKKQQTPMQRVSKNLKVPQTKAKDLIKAMLRHGKKAIESNK